MDQVDGGTLLLDEIGYMPDGPFNGVLVVKSSADSVVEQGHNRCPPRRHFRGRALDLRSASA